MKIVFAIIFSVIYFNAFSQNRDEYLQNNRFDLRCEEFVFPQNDFKIVGFGAYHGSSKTYDAELLLLKSLLKNSDIDFYFIEANYSQAHFINKYLLGGNEDNLKMLVTAFGTIVSQESTIDTYMHWQNFKKINDSLSPCRKIKVVGVDIVNEYHFPIKHLLELTSEKREGWEKLSNLADSIYSNPFAYKASSKNPINNQLKEFIDDYNS